MPDAQSDERVLVLAPTARDAALCRSILADAAVAAEPCGDVAAVCRELEAGAGAAILTEEALTTPGFGRLVEALGRQPSWSDLPVIVLTREGAASEVALRTLESLGNVTLLERPVRVPTLVSAVRTALRARRRQYQVRDHLAEIQRIADALKQADRQKDEFLAMLAHELRNPLAPIRNALHLLKAAGGNGAPPAGVRDLMERQVGHLVRLVDDLLDVSRILRGRVELRTEPLDLADALGQAVETARPLIDANGHALTVAVPPGGIPVVGDVVRLTQVFANLLNNAAKYTEPGGAVAVTAGAEDGWAVVRVTDTGVGIPPELLPRVFDLFTQAERTLDRSQGGLGLGLTLVKRLTEMHGGAVEVHSAGPGRGSEFVVRLPLAAGGGRNPPGPSRQHQGVHTPRPPQSRRVLVVDDNVDAAQSLALVLRAEGHAVATAFSGPAALEAAGDFRPEVVLLDIGLPGLSGYDVARRLRELPGLTGALLVAVTGYGQEDDVRRAREVGFDHHLTKPLDPDELAPLLARARPTNA